MQKKVSSSMEIKLNSVYVDDQDKAFKFYSAYTFYQRHLKGTYL